MLDNCQALMHSAHMKGTFISRLRERRRQRKLAHDQELSFRQQVDAATAAAARLAEDLHRT
jgi:hypothetical protein